MEPEEAAVSPVHAQLLHLLHRHLDSRGGWSAGTTPPAAAQREEHQPTAAGSAAMAVEAVETSEAEKAAVRSDHLETNVLPAMPAAPSGLGCAMATETTPYCCMLSYYVIYGAMCHLCKSPGRA